MFWPKNAVPLSALVLPVMTSIMVVFPAPLGPMMQRNSPVSIMRLRLFSALKPSKLTVMSSKIEDRAVRKIDLARLDDASVRRLGIVPSLQRRVVVGVHERRAVN